MYILCLIIIIKSEVWNITHCLGLGHETMVCAVCPFYILRGRFPRVKVTDTILIDAMLYPYPYMYIRFCKIHRHQYISILHSLSDIIILCVSHVQRVLGNDYPIHTWSLGLIVVLHQSNLTVFFIGTGANIWMAQCEQSHRDEFGHVSCTNHYTVMKIKTQQNEAKYSSVHTVWVILDALIQHSVWPGIYCSTVLGDLYSQNCRSAYI